MMLFVLLGLSVRITAASAPVAAKPVLLYSLRYQAPGENRYPPQGSYKPILDHLTNAFEVRISTNAPSARLLQDVAVVLIANPNENAVGTNPPPIHLERPEILEWATFIGNGGGLILLGNQEGHNLETTRFNLLLARFGLTVTNRYHDAKEIAVPDSTPVIGGLRWAYYTGNEVLLTASHPARPQAWVTNDVSTPTATGRRNETGILLAVAEPLKGRVVVATDAGWLSRNALENIGIGGVVLAHHDNAELFERLTLWAAHRR
jgi:hypothetical protein